MQHNYKNYVSDDVLNEYYDRELGNNAYYNVKYILQYQQAILQLEDTTTSQHPFQKERYHRCNKMVQKEM